MFKLVIRTLIPAIAIIATTAAGVTAQPASSADGLSGCDTGALSASQEAFQELLALKESGQGTVSAEELRAASIEYMGHSETCYHALYGEPAQPIDDGGVWLTSQGTISDPFLTQGNKWGAGTVFPAGQDAHGPGIPGGTVTYSFMADGVDNSPEGFDANVAIASLPGYLACFTTEITTAFAVWSSVANIQFSLVADSGTPFNAGGATGDIRIGAHSFDGASGVLAHAYYPPPNGSSASGDMHFDRQENWACAPGAGVIDIGIVAEHELGHSIGLAHEPVTGNTALMNPFYNPAVVSTIAPDDINGAEQIYGAGPVDLAIDFGPGTGIYTLNDYTTWSLLHPLSADPFTDGPFAGADLDVAEAGAGGNIVLGDIDGNGIDETIIDFGGPGIYIWMNNSSWVQLHNLSPTRMVVGDIDRNGLDDVIIDFPGLGIYAYMNNASWVQLHNLNSEIIVTGDIDGDGRDDVVVDFGAAYGIYAWLNNTSWVQLHGLSPLQMISGAVGARDWLLIDFPGAGLYAYDNGSWIPVHPFNAAHLAYGDLNADGRAEAIIDFGPGIGIWVYSDSIPFTQIHTFSAESMVGADVDGNGQRDVVVDFGAPYGIYIWLNNTSWVQLHGLDPAGMAAGDLSPTF